MVPAAPQPMERVACPACGLGAVRVVRHAGKLTVEECLVCDATPSQLAELVASLPADRFVSWPHGPRWEIAHWTAVYAACATRRGEAHRATGIAALELGNARAGNGEYDDTVDDYALALRALGTSDREDDHGRAIGCVIMQLQGSPQRIAAAARVTPPRFRLACPACGGTQIRVHRDGGVVVVLDPCASCGASAFACKRALVREWPYRSTPWPTDAHADRRHYEDVLASIAHRPVPPYQLGLCTYGLANALTALELYAEATAEYRRAQQLFTRSDHPDLVTTCDTLLRLLAGRPSHAATVLPPPEPIDAGPLLPLELDVMHGEKRWVHRVESRRVGIGRAPDADLRLQSGRVSRRHCVIEWVDGAFWIEDQASTEGVRLAGTRVEGRRRIADGDVYVIGDVTIRCRLTMPIPHLEGPYR